MLSTILPFLFISLIYYIPALLFISTAKLQYKNKSTYQNINSKTNGVQSFWVFVAYFFLIGLIGFTLCVLYIVTKKELIDDDFVLLLLTLIVPNIIQFIVSIEKGDVEEINRTCKQIPITDLDDYMIAEISAAALLTQNEDILDTLFKCGIDFRKDFRDEIYGFSKKPYDIAKGLGARKSLKWFESKYE